MIGAIKKEHPEHDPERVQRSTPGRVSAKDSDVMPSPGESGRGAWRDPGGGGRGCARYNLRAVLAKFVRYHFFRHTY